jgi:hypothetical protein
MPWKPPGKIGAVQLRDLSQTLVGLALGAQVHPGMEQGRAEDNE